MWSSPKYRKIHPNAATGKMNKHFFNRDVECLPLEKLIALQETNLIASEIVKFAAPLSLYHENWKNHGINPRPLSGRQQLKTMPYIDSNLLKQSYASHNLSKVVNLRYARAWSCTSGTTGTGKWIPYADDDLNLFKQILMRDFYMRCGSSKPYRALAFTSPAPFVADLLTNLTTLALAENGLHQEIIPIGLNADPDTISLARRRHADVLVAFPSVAMRIAEEITAKIQNEISRQNQETKGLKHLLTRLIIQIKKPSVRDIFRLRYGLFNGESVEPYRSALRKSFGIEPFETYAFTEFPCLNMDCEEHDGIHIWSDCCVPEIIPQTELDKEETIPGYKPLALFLDEAPQGMTGEYVITTFNHALPLLRYRTSDLIQVVSTSTCKCGRTPPRIKVLRRLDDVVNMGMIRFSIQEIDKVLAKVRHHGSIRQWQMLLSRNGYKPSLQLKVAGIKITDSLAFTEEIRQCLSGISILVKGIEAGLVCPPEIRLESEIDEKTTATGKAQRIIYASNW
jgi:phenylacetate-CoA ligase